MDQILYSRPKLTILHCCNASPGPILFTPKVIMVASALQKLNAEPPCQINSYPEFICLATASSDQMLLMHRKKFSSAPSNIPGESHWSIAYKINYSWYSVVCCITVKCLLFVQACAATGYSPSTKRDARTTWQAIRARWRRVSYLAEAGVLPCCWHHCHIDGDDTAKKSPSAVVLLEQQQQSTCAVAG